MSTHQEGEFFRNVVITKNLAEMKQASELLFEGKIPAEFSIVESDVTSVKIPLPYHVRMKVDV